MIDIISMSLEEKIKKSLNSSNLSIIFKNLEAINSSTLICGIGGSHVVSIFLEKVLTIKNKVIALNISAEEYFLRELSNYKNLIMVSHSGKNHGIKSLAETPKNKYLLTTRKSKISNETILNYKVIDGIKSFISLDNTFIPLSIVLCYYMETYEFPNNIFPTSENFNILEFNNVNIIYDYNSKTCATFLETSLVEAGIANVTKHTKYSFCHGRSNLVSNIKSLVIYLNTNNSELDNLLLNEIPKITKNILILEELNYDSIIADYILTIKALHFFNYLNKKYHKEFVKVKYNKIVPTIYNFKGELI